MLCCSACTWINISSSNKIQRNYMGLKITACMCNWGKLWAKDTKSPKNPTATSEELGGKTGCLEQKQGTLHGPCTQYHTAYKEPACFRAQARDPVTCFPLLPDPFNKGPKKALPEFFLSGLWPISIDWGRPGTLAGIYTIDLRQCSLIHKIPILREKSS